MSNESGASLNWVVAMVFAATNFLCWGFAAAAYTNDVVKNVRVDGRLTFIGMAFGRIPEFFAVLGHTFSNHFWIVITWVVLMAIVGAGAFGLKKLEGHLSESPRRRY